LISPYPEIEVPTDYKDVRRKLIRDYGIFYRVSDVSIRTLRIWDNRRNPEYLKIE